MVPNADCSYFAMYESVFLLYIIQYHDKIMTGKVVLGFIEVTILPRGFIVLHQNIRVSDFEITFLIHSNRML